MEVAYDPPTREREEQWLNEDEAVRVGLFCKRTLRRHAMNNPRGEVEKIRRIYQRVSNGRAVPLFPRDDIIALVMAQRN